MPVVHRLTRLTLLPALSLVVFTGCVVDLNKTLQNLAKPSVAFETPTDWDCPDTTVRLPGRSGIQECSGCRNATKAVSVVTIKDRRLQVNPGEKVYLCPTSVVVSGQPVE
jgi:hypothetical protein